MTRLAEQLKAAGTANPCETCAFVDPEAWVCDPEIPAKLRECVADGQMFRCHAEAETDADGAYQLPRTPDGKEDGRAMPICAGFLRLYAKLRALPIDEREDELDRIRAKMLERYVKKPGSENGAKLVEAARGNPEALAVALDMLAYQKRMKRQGVTVCATDALALYEAGKS